MRFVPGYSQGSGSQRGRFNRRTNRRPFRGATYGFGASSGSARVQDIVVQVQLLLLVSSVQSSSGSLLHFSRSLFPMWAVWTHDQKLSNGRVSIAYALTVLCKCGAAYLPATSGILSAI